MVSISIDEGLLLDLERLARELGRPLEAITADALRGYVSTARQIVDDVAESRAQLARGEGIELDDIDGALAHRRARRA